MARKDSNPEKAVMRKLSYKRHRVIMPFYIPNITEPYFKNAVNVLDLCLTSLVSTIDHTTTNITLINNASCNEAHELAQRFVQSGKIDRYIICLENRGKVEPCLSEVRSSFEDYVSIIDADVLFFEGWEQAVFDIFNAIPRAGAVSCVPSPQVAKYNNYSVFLSSKIRSGKFCKDDDLDLFAEGIGNINIYNNSKSVYTWKEQQLIIEGHNIKACIGAGHFCTTYKRVLLESINKKPVEIAFKNGLENYFIDRPIDLNGFYRLSTIKTYAYHLGNNIPQKYYNYSHNKDIVKTTINTISTKKNIVGYLSYKIRCIISRIIIKLFHESTK